MKKRPVIHYTCGYGLAACAPDSARTLRVSNDASEVTCAKCRPVIDTQRVIREVRRVQL